MRMSQARRVAGLQCAGIMGRDAVLTLLTGVIHRYLAFWIPEAETQSGPPFIARQFGLQH